MSLEFDEAICRNCSSCGDYDYCGKSEAVDRCDNYMIDAGALEAQAHGSTNLRRGFRCSTFKKVHRQYS